MFCFNFIKLDSNIQKTNNLFPELKEVYTYIINYYKEKDDKEKQLFYIDRFLKVNTKLDEQFKYAGGGASRVGHGAQPVPRAGAAAADGAGLCACAAVAGRGVDVGVDAGGGAGVDPGH